MTYTEASTNVIGRSSGSATLDLNDRRKKLIIQNTHATNILYVKLAGSGTVDSTAANYDLQIAAKGSFVLDNYTGAVKAGATTVNFVELG